jgi:hypothetical protein
VFKPAATTPTVKNAQIVQDVYFVGEGITITISMRERWSLIPEHSVIEKANINGQIITNGFKIPL